MSLRSHCATLIIALASCTGVQERDAGIDMGVDAGRGPGDLDAGNDGGAVDAGVDAGREMTRWVPLEGLPPECEIQRAENPETLLDNRWEVCPDSIGCVRLVDDPRFVRTPAPVSRGFSGGVAYFQIVEGYSPYDPLLGERIVVLAGTDGSVLGGWKGPPLGGDVVCQVDPLTVGDGQAAFGVSVFDTETMLNKRPLFRAPLAEIGSANVPYKVLDESDLPGWNVVQSLEVSPTTLVADVRPGGFLYVFEGTDRDRLGGVSSTINGVPQNVFLVGDHVLWEDWGSKVRVAHGSLAEPESVFVELSGANDVHGFSTDGIDMAWQQLYDKQPDGTYARIELWTAPYVRDPADLAPRMVTSLAERQPEVVHSDGVYAFLFADLPDRYALYDLADGRRRVLTMPDRFGGRAPVSVSRDEVLIRGTRGRLRRYSLSSLPYEP